LLSFLLTVFLLRNGRWAFKIYVILYHYLGEVATRKRQEKTVPGRFLKKYKKKAKKQLTSPVVSGIISHVAGKKGILGA